MVHENSLEAYSEIIANLPKKRGRVFDTINQFQPISRQQIADILGWKINQVCGRIVELKELQLIKEVDDVKSKLTGKTVSRLAIRKPADPENKTGESLKVRVGFLEAENNQLKEANRVLHEQITEKDATIKALMEMVRDAKLDNSDHLKQLDNLDINYF